MFLTLFADRVLFRADDGAHGTELWTSDGTADGTKMLVDINPAGSASPMRPTIAGNRVFFSTDDGVSGAEPWLSDGTAAGTRLLLDINPTGASNPASFTAAPTGVDQNGLSTNIELYRLDVSGSSAI